LKYIKANAAKLAPLACEHPALLYLMMREKLIAAKHLDAVSEAVQASRNTELIAAILEYGSSAVSAKDKAKARAKKEEREENVTNFIFDAEKVETLSDKTIVVTGKLNTFTSRDELKECLEAVGAVLTETIAPGVDYLLTNTPNSGTAKNKKAEELGIQKITEQEFNDLIDRHKA
jgi:DNA ligase (NAD+)